MFSGISIPRVESASMLVFWLIVINLGFNVLSNAAFRVSATSPNWRGLLIWQVVGNLAGFVTVITLTWMLKYMPLSVAFPLTTGLTVLGVQMVAASWIFNEPVSQRQWLGTLAIVVCIWLIQRYTIFPYPRALGAFGEFWENFYGWWLMWTYNPVSARYRKMLEMQHTEFWMTRDKFLDKFGET